MNVAIILAGGKGTRMGIVNQPKQFVDIYGKPLIVHTLEAFDLCQKIDKVCVVCLNEWHEDIRIWIRKYDLNKVEWIVSGGQTRQQSVFNGLNAIKDKVNKDDIVIIHDAARPLISNRIIEDNILGAEKFGAVDTVIPTSDTIIKSKDNFTINSVPIRKELYLGQTPQSFRFSLIYKAHEIAIKDKYGDSTDDCQLVLRLKHNIHLISGEKLNFKITTMDDLLLLKAIIKLGKMERV